MIMYVLYTPLGEVLLKLESTSVDQWAKLQIYGKANGVAFVQTWLSLAYGLHGERIHEGCHPLDLAHVLASDDAALFAPRLMRGAAILAQVPTPPSEDQLW